MLLGMVVCRNCRVDMGGKASSRITRMLIGMRMRLFSMRMRVVVCMSSFLHSRVSSMVWHWSVMDHFRSPRVARSGGVRGGA